ncbi:MULTISPECIES: NYN domain-containing protein [unclassified Candidatus Paralachnospira]|uniref:NYN domain-containing protein n=1 Tax=unclassified Candidatus Paralachnospira TaxID=3099471 RepID=UPI00302E957B
MNKELKFAILIDADNISEKYIKIILDETAKSGIATYKRIYGDWTNPQLSSWKRVLLDNSIIPIQQYGYTTGKSATDSAMIIDAMDILYTGGVDGFCLASSDSDFTRLAARLRESGMQVIGMGESKTPKAFISACNQFKYLDILLSSSQEEPETVTEPADLPSAESEKAVAVKKNRSQSKRTKQKKQEPEPQPQTNLKTIKKAILSLVEECSDDDGWIFSAELGNQLAKRFPDFDVRNFGFSKFTPFINSLGMFDVKRNQANSNSNVQLVYFKLKS